MADPIPTTDAAPAAAVAPTSVQPAAAPAAKTDVAPVAEKPAETKPAETKPAEKATDASPLGKKDEAKPAEKKPDEAAAAPIKYEFKIPEGLQADEKALASFSELGNKFKLPPEAAQELLDFHAGSLKAAVAEITKSVTDANTKTFNDTIGKWQGELKSDPELSGSNEPVVHELLGKFLDEYGSPEAREAFDMTGAGWNPAVVKMMVKAAKALSEGQATLPGNPPKGKEPKTPGSVFYPPKSN